MLLEDYIPTTPKKYRNAFFSGIAFDSTKVKKDHIFFAIKGNKIDGNNFISAAIKKGCKIVVTEKKIKEFKNGILFIHTKNVRKLLAEVSYRINEKKPKNLIAVTGTNGKSSIADFYYQILKYNYKKVASIGTLGVKSKKINLNLSNTTIDPIQLSQILKKLKKNHVDNVIMEASSHGLKQNRLDGLKFNSGIFTNLSQDHLDYHKNFKDYLNAKLYLFKNLIKKKGNIITDKTIPEFQEIKKISTNKNLKLNTIYGKKNNLEILSHSFKGVTQVIKIKHHKITKKVNLNLVGKVQIKNIMMAILAAQKSNLSLDKILAVVPKLKAVEGRLEIIGKIKNQSKVILDYAHTPDALKTCLLNLREQFLGKKISLIFGCGGDRDKNKRSKMGKIASTFADMIYLTDDNPRSENPSKIRKDIKKGIKNKNVVEISDRKKAILEAIENLKSNDILLVAGKGHEKFQYVGNNKIYFSDKEVILKGIKTKNLDLSNDLKLNIIKEVSGNKELSSTLSINKAKINSREVKKNDIFFAIKGKKNDGNKFVDESFKKKASLAIVNKIQRKLNLKQQIKVENTLKFLTDVSKVFRKNINTKLIAITGSCGKTTLKELLGNSLRKFSKVSVSPKSYNNKFGVPLSLFNLNSNDDFGVLELGMDKKGEIDYLSKIAQPDVSVITNINYAHAKNFRNIKQIALAKAEIISNTKPGGFVVLNADDNFFGLHKEIAHKNNLKIISFGIKSIKSDIKLTSIKKRKKFFRININVGNIKKHFIISNNFENNIYNILATLSVMSIYIEISKLKKNLFLNFEIPMGRGDISKIRIKNKNVYLIDESYNSNPLSLKSAILNYDKINVKNSNKYLLLGDMLELGNHSKKLHKSITPIINKTNIDKVFVKGNKVKIIFDKLSKSKKGKILLSEKEIIDLIKEYLNDNDYLMVKASNATGFNTIVKKLRRLN